MSRAVSPGQQDWFLQVWLSDPLHQHHLGLLTNYTFQKWYQNYMGQWGSQILPCLTKA